jgi:tetratricopeptide (TPR) repeat protein
MKAKAPADRRKFEGEWDEIGYLYDKLLYWLYEREDFDKSRPYADRLLRLLPKASPNHEGIFGEECWSLAYEAKGDLRKAIKHRENEIRLIERLHKISVGTPHESVALRNYGYQDWSDRLDLLAMLHHDVGHLERALAILRQSRRLCERHGVRFDGEDLVEQYLAEKRKMDARRRRKRALAS